MGNLIDIQGQIEKLQKQANEIRAKEFSKTVQEIVAKMRAFGITPADLKFSSRIGKAKATSKRQKIDVVKVGKTHGSSVAAKYQGPNGETWSGRGLTPRWLVSLIASGRKKEEFAIKG
jgi:DNA-binding protein H-NS